MGLRWDELRCVKALCRGRVDPGSADKWNQGKRLVLKWRRTGPAIWGDRTLQDKTEQPRKGLMEARLTRL